MHFESEEEYIAFRTWEYKMAQSRLDARNAQKKKAPSIPVSGLQKRKIAYLRNLFLDKDPERRLSRTEMRSILAQADKKNTGKSDTISFLVKAAHAIVRSR